MTTVDVTLLVLCFSFVLSLIRAALGPTLADRAVATDVCLFCVVGALALFGVRSGSAVYVDTMLVATLLGFIATVSLARLLRRRRPDEEEG
ncbi:MAG TPA: monovalent cation/H+ antiporter complex subunit F [Actinomycetota bacterium]|nr:monovalent cation/H+ antiporter complex subunit F [Actinomycetota bacterium]